jgi:Transcriptional regulators
MTSRHRRNLVFRRLHESIIDLMAIMNMPQRDDALIAEAGVDLDRALFRLLIGIQRLGPIGVVELAERAGRDHTTVSRQVAKLAELGLIERRPSPTDRRVKEAVITDAGRRVTDALAAARLRLVAPVFAEWSDRDLFEFDRLLRRCVDDMIAMSTIEKDKDD